MICEGNAKQMNSTKGGLATTARAKVGRHDRALLIGAITNRHVRKVKRIHVSWVRSMQPCSAAKDSMQEITETEPLNRTWRELYGRLPAGQSEIKCYPQMSKTDFCVCSKTAALIDKTAPVPVRQRSASTVSS